MSSSDFDTYGMKRDWLVGYNKDKNSALGPNGYKMFDPEQSRGSQLDDKPHQRST